MGNLWDRTTTWCDPHPNQRSDIAPCGCDKTVFWKVPGSREVFQSFWFLVFGRHFSYMFVVRNGLILIEGSWVSSFPIIFPKVRQTPRICLRKALHQYWLSLWRNYELFLLLEKHNLRSQRSCQFEFRLLAVNYAVYDGNVFLRSLSLQEVQERPTFNNIVLWSSSEFKFVTMDKSANSKSSRKYEGRLLCLCLTAACLSAPLNGLSPSLTLVASEFGFNAKERDIYLGKNYSWNLDPTFWLEVLEN